MDDLRLYVLQSYQDIGEGDNERLCAMKPRFRVERFPLRARFEPGTASSASRRLTRVLEEICPIQYVLMIHPPLFHPKQNFLAKRMPT